MYATTGLRRGEALGLTWRDVDLDGGTIAIAKARVSTERGVVDSSPKSGRGRAVALDSGTVATLREHRKHQLEERLAWGPAYADEGLRVLPRGRDPLLPRLRHPRIS